MKKSLSLTLSNGEERYWTCEQDWHYEVNQFGVLTITVDGAYKGAYKGVFGAGQWVSLEEMIPE